MICLTLLLLITIFLSQASLIGFQAHSYDDLREWKTLFSKGATWIKIDIGLQAQVLNASGGCFLLSHDTPDKSIQYNSSDDLVSILGDPSFRPWFSASEVSQPGPQVTIALCFKTDGFSPCDGSRTALLWLQLTQQVLDTFARQVNMFDLSVEFLMDGSATGGDCILQLWRPLNFTFIYLRNPVAAITSNNRTAGLDRYQVNNMEAEGAYGASDLIAMRDQYKYGKFLNARYPFLLWEPSDQVFITKIVADYLAGPLNSPEVGGSGLRFAINIDPVQFQIYAARGADVASSSRAKHPPTPLRGRSEPTQDFQAIAEDSVSGAWNVPLSDLGISPLLAAVPSLQNAELILAAVYAQSNASAVPLYRLFAAATDSQGAYVSLTALSAPTALPLSHGLLSFRPVAWLSLPVVAQAFFVAADADGVGLVFALGKSTAFSFVAQLELVSTPGATKTFALQALNEAVGGAVRLVQAFASATCQLALQAWSLNLTTFAPLPVGSAVCVIPGSGSAVARAALLVASLGSATQTDGCEANAARVLLSADSAAAPSVVSVAHACLDSTGVHAPSRAVPFGPGASPAFAGVSDPSLPLDAALLTWGDGYCWNHHSANTRAGPKLCDSVPMTLSGILTYTVASVAAMVQLIDNFSAASARAFAVDVCIDGVLHGMFDMGSHSSLAAVAAPGRRLAVFELHEGLLQTDAGSNNETGNPPDLSLCGLALPHAGLVLDYWLLPAPCSS